MAGTFMTNNKERQTITGEISFPVYYEDTDFTGFVYHANYLKFFERAREHLVGIDQLKLLFDAGYHYVVGEIKIRYKYPAKHGDVLAIQSEVTLSRGSLALFNQKAVLKRPDGTETIVVTGEVKTVLIDKTGRPCNLPEDLYLNFSKALQGI
jgi:acyl-CoA thioester hydrolase